MGVYFAVYQTDPKTSTEIQIAAVSYFYEDPNFTTVTITAAAPTHLQDALSELAHDIATHTGTVVYRRVPD